MAKAKGGSGFERDLGYLLPFLDRVEGAAKALSDPASRERLLLLVTEERQRWAEIQALLGGAKPAAAPLERPREGAKAPVKPPEDRATLTVGSLRKR